ncbi:zinc finger protein ZFP2-like [Cydia strobilella]|uniref:zinc finger protein ZFP2-like n=1 Tax=Cydia strobilella TaxID=1100964 RepID=UPI00300441F0
MDSIKLEMGSEAEELQACRICLATDVRLFGIYDNRLDEIFIDIMGSTLSVWDGLPQHLCSSCGMLLLKSGELRRRCRRAELLLRQYTHTITTDFIRTIDRVANKLSLHLSITKINSDTDTKPDTSIDTELDTETKLDIDLKLDDDKQDSDENDSQSVSVFCEPEIFVSDVKYSQVIAADIANRMTLRKRVKTEKKSKKKVKVKVKEAPGKQKKGFKWFFSTEEDYVKFENKYNIRVVKLNEEEQRREMEARRESENYRHAHVRCEKCCKGFLSLITFENHNKIHDPSTGANECPLCFSRYKFPTHLRQHVVESHAHKYVCKVCDQVIRRRSAAMLHSAFHAGRTFECKYCGRTFKKSSTRYTHMRIQHPGENASGGACDVCGETFTGALGLQQHKTRKHNKPAVPELKCSVCLVQFASLDAVARHTDTTPDNTCDPSLKACSACGETFPDESRLSAHCSAHADTRYKCDDCNQPFATKSSLSTHIDRVHLKIKPRYKLIYKYSAARRAHLDEYMCETCGKGYTSFANLKTHQLRHTGERPFPCPLCPKSFLTAAQAKGHKERVHAGIKKYQCAQCPKTFLDKSSVYKHKVVHTGEKPYGCQICNKTFTQSGSLSTHIKYVHMKVKPPPRRRRGLVASGV